MKTTTTGHLPAEQLTVARQSTHKWDLSIAHAGEDKDAFVRPLAGQLEQLGARVWYDEFQLKPGDSLLATIDRELADSAFGLLVIS